MEVVTLIVYFDSEAAVGSRHQVKERGDPGHWSYGTTEAEAIKDWRSENPGKGKIKLSLTKATKT